MSNVKELVGFEYEPYCFEVEKGKIREFAMAIGDDNPIYYDLRAAEKEGYEGIPIPFTFLQVIDMWGGNSFQENAKKLKLNLLKILHGEQECELVADIYAGDVLTVTAKIIDIDVKRGSSGEMDVITTEHKYVNQNDELAATSKSTIIHRH